MNIIKNIQKESENKDEKNMKIFLKKKKKKKLQYHREHNKSLSEKHKKSQLSVEEIIL